MRVMALHPEDKQRPGACELYRINQPFYHLGKAKDWQVGYDNARSIFAEWYMAFVNGDQGLSVFQFLKNLDAIVLPRFRATDNGIRDFVVDFFDIAHELGVKTIYEVDDDFTNEHRVVIEGSMEDIAGRCDAITVTTPYLAETMKKAFRKPTYVLPNMLDPMIWRDGEVRRNLSEDRPLIWLSGSATHQGDWKVLAEVFPALLQKHPETVLVICGFMPEYLKGIEGAVFMEGVDYRTYAHLVRQSDIVLAPVDPNDGFNMGKSPIKSVEGMGAVRKIQNQLCGAAVIATNNPVYRLAVRHGLDGMLVEHEPSHWFEALDKLLTDVPYRQRLQAQAYNTVWKKGKWDITRNWTMWAEAYKKIKALPKRKSKMSSPQLAKE